MTPNDFVETIRALAMGAAVDDTVAVLARQPGRRPSPDLVELSTWYQELDNRGQERLRSAIELAARQAVFGVLAIIDGARAASDEAGAFELTFRSERGVVPISGAGGAVLHEML